MKYSRIGCPIQHSTFRTTYEKKKKNMEYLRLARNRAETTGGITATGAGRLDPSRFGATTSEEQLVLARLSMKKPITRAHSSAHLTDETDMTATAKPQ